jgi:hypothetical protein
MPKAFAPLDDALFERLFQPASDLISYHIGLGRTAVACFCIDIACLAWIVSCAPMLSSAVAAWNGSAVCGLALPLLGLAALVSLRMLFRRTGNTLANPLRLAMQPHRAVALLLLVASLARLHAPSLADAADLAMLMSAASALYLGACVERPPIRRGRWRVAQALGGFGQLRRSSHRNMTNPGMHQLLALLLVLAFAVWSATADPFAMARNSASSASVPGSFSHTAG